MPNAFTSEEQLLESAKKLEGLRVADVAKLISKGQTTDLTHKKGLVSRIIETDYFGISPNIDENPDFKNLGVELKVSPLSWVNGPCLFTTKERNVIKMVDYYDVFNNEKWEMSKLIHKLKRVLFVLYVHDNFTPPDQWLILSSFLWTPSPQEKIFIQNDYNIIREKIMKGIANSERDNSFLGTCPKHGGGFNTTNPSLSVASSIAQHPTMSIAQKRGYCIKRDAFIELIARCLGQDLVRSGGTIGLPPSAFPVLNKNLP